MVTSPLTEARRKALCDWLTANGVKPADVPEDSAFIIRVDEQQRRVLSYVSVVRDPETGNILANAQDGTPVWETREVPLIVEPPEWWMACEPPSREQLLARVAELRKEVARLRDGEEPGHDPHTEPTPGQWIARWNTASAAQRLDVARQIIASAARADRCFLADHERRLDEQRHTVTTLARVRDEVARWKRNTLMPQTMRALDDIDRALRGAGTAGAEETCRLVEVDGETACVRGAGEFTEQEQQFTAEIIRAAKRKYATEHPEENTMATCTATIEGPHIPGGGPIQCDLDAHPDRPESHVGPKQEDGSRVLWTDHHAGATPHGAAREAGPDA